MPATGAAARWEAEPAHASACSAQASRTALYGGLVGDLIGEIEHRMVAVATEAPAPVSDEDDVFHRLSVAAGYLGLAAGCAATVLGVAALL